MSKQPMIEYFDRANPHPSLNAPTQAKADKVPKDKDSAKVEVKEGAEMGSKKLQESPTTEQSSVSLLPRDKIEEAIRELQESTTIENDRGKVVPFEGETKEAFINFSKEAYPVAEKMLETIYETGGFLYEVRDQEVSSLFQEENLLYL